MSTRILFLARALAALALAALACACAPLLPGHGELPPDALARITSIEGPNAFVDAGSRGVDRPAQPGQAVFAGDRFHTGAATRMALELAGGGSIELDENTDPGLLRDLQCLVVNLFLSGRIFVDRTGACVESLGTRSQQFSKVVYAVMPAGPYVQITVVAGEARTVLPTASVVPTGWRVDLDRRAILGGGKPYAVSEQALRDAIAWTRYYRDQQRATPGFDFRLLERTMPRAPADRDGARPRGHGAPSGRPSSPSPQ